jgi:hypothetical protein
MCCFLASLLPRASPCLPVPPRASPCLPVPPRASCVSLGELLGGFFLRLPCACLAPALRLPCACLASALRLPCVCLAHGVWMGGVAGGGGLGVAGGLPRLHQPCRGCISPAAAASALTRLHQPSRVSISPHAFPSALTRFHQPSRVSISPAAFPSALTRLHQPQEPDCVAILWITWRLPPLTRPLFFFPLFHSSNGNPGQHAGRQLD